MLDMDVVLIPLLKFYFHEKGVINANTTTTILYLHQPHYSANLPNQGDCACPCGFQNLAVRDDSREPRPRSGKKLRKPLQQYNPKPARMIISLIYSLSSAPKPMIDGDLKDRHYCNPQPQKFALDECGLTKTQCWFIIVANYSHNQLSTANNRCCR